MLLQAVDGRDVVAGDPALAILGLGLTPFPIVIVSQDPELFACEDKTPSDFSPETVTQDTLILIADFEPNPHNPTLLGSQICQNSTGCLH